MKHIFVRANESLFGDLERYAEALRTIVAALPEARALCDKVLREVRLAEALLAFGSGAQIVEIGQAIFHLGDLWPYREHGPTRTAGFSDEIAEAARHREEARKAMGLLGRLPDQSIASELRTCLGNIQRYLQEEQKLLETCHAHIQPFSANSDLTRKRLSLLIAAAEARLPESEERRRAVATYQEAADLLRSADGGVPIDESGLAILNRCIGLLGSSSELFGILGVAARSSGAEGG